MKKLLAVLTIVFALLSIVGVSYIILSKRQIGPGLAVIPMLISLILCSFYITITRKR
ncbi:MAG: hypothetical protein KIC47_11060 [Clostridium sp.]|nr:hypothetical protein [Clostridium sp.]MBS5950838.1 hypothetical protein [Clostridium sp.]